MAYSEPVSPSKDSLPSSQDHSQDIQQTNASDSNGSIRRLYNIVAFWKKEPARQQPTLPPSTDEEPRKEPREELPVVRRSDLLIMMAQMESHAKSACQALLNCKVDGDKQKVHSDKQS